jgi:hypothetical protein
MWERSSCGDSRPRLSGGAGSLGRSGAGVYDSEAQIVEPRNQ